MISLLQLQQILDIANFGLLSIDFVVLSVCVSYKMCVNVNNSDEVIRNTGAIVQKGSGEWESRVFQQAKNGVFQCNFMYICCISTVSTTYPLIIYHLATVNNNFVARL